MVAAGSLRGREGVGGAGDIGSVLTLLRESFPPATLGGRRGSPEGSLGEGWNKRVPLAPLLEKVDRREMSHRRPRWRDAFLV